jgi:predicted enzyme related to lactoylglutathione lyase
MAAERLHGDVRIATVRARDWAGMVRYYRECLGLEQRFADETSQYAMFDAGPIRLAVEGPAMPALARDPGAGALVLNFEVPDLAEAVRALRENAAQVLGEVRHRPGYSYATVRDPEGNQHIVYQRRTPPAA